MAHTHAQTKFEREYRIKVENIPKKAKDFIDQCFFHQKTKWYAEESQDGKTIEAKTLYNDHKYSIEFSTDGNVLDVEKKIKFDNLKTAHKNQITTTLKELFSKYKIIKTQIQWKADNHVLVSLIKDGYTNKQYSLHYEMVIKAKKEKGYHLYEVLFTPNGEAIKILKIVQRNSDNLQF
ncbi:hypothetical protein [Aquimarina sp. 2201CG5-10]|uniref:hypothetical protein n=1 Tax=Aquimarina callyspongiae TaxID=3098150 RepID=UPI002AB41237|nr:hypothetical protein [Aquimarina sp. 2201CG5-10]MDY8137326.1 hypothetical protein [Aquimarina sp. 2201CG5-10]